MGSYRWLANTTKGFSLLPTGFGHSLVKHRRAGGQHEAVLAPIGSIALLPAGSTDWPDINETDYSANHLPEVFVCFF